MFFFFLVQPGFKLDVLIAFVSLLKKVRFVKNILMGYYTNFFMYCCFVVLIYICVAHKNVDRMKHKIAEARKKSKDLNSKLSKLSKKASSKDSSWTKI